MRPSIGTAVMLIAAALTTSASAEPWALSEARGCFAATADGERIGCINIVSGRLQMEAKNTRNRRVYRVELLGTEARPLDQSATPAARWQAATKWLQGKGYSWIPSVGASAQGLVAVPGGTCQVGIDSSARYLETVTPRGHSGSAERRAFLEVGGPGGKPTLISIAHHADSGQLLIVLDHDLSDAEGPLLLRQLKVIKDSELIGRPECSSKGKETPTD